MEQPMERHLVNAVFPETVHLLICLVQDRLYSVSKYKDLFKSKH